MDLHDTRIGFPIHFSGLPLAKGAKGAKQRNAAIDFASLANFA
jgi:hypothetical protein